ncbi:MAG: transcription termination factor Rho [Actinomycetota bacterium]
MAADALEKSVLESKDKEQLIAIATALGLKASARAKKEDIITNILATVGGPEESESGGTGRASARSSATKATKTGTSPKSREGSTEKDGAEESSDTKPAASSGRAATTPVKPASTGGDDIILGPDGEPLAEWEAALVRQGEATVEDLVGGEGPAGSAPSGQRRDHQRSSQHQSGGGQSGGQGGGNQQGGQRNFDGESRNRRRRRRGRGGRDEGPQGEDRDGFSASDRAPGESFQQETTEVSGYLDLRDEGYGFVRVKGYLPSRDDAYISVKLTRQHGLRKGDFITGMARSAGRNEKNPALIEVLSVNGGNPDSGKGRPRFEDLTALFPDEKLRLESPLDPTNMTARIIDLIAPIGKGQRGIIVSPPKAGKTTIMKEIATAIERNNPEVTLMVLLIDERPEEVTDMKRTVRGEVISSTFDRPSDEHTHVAELAIEKAKRLVEAGKDVVIILDGITRLSRAYNLAAPASGRILSGGIDAGALYPPKKFFGAARNIEEGGSLTILATALVETNSRMDEAIFEEFKGTGNMELRLDRRLAEKRIYPAIDVDSSSTRHEELLFDRKQLQMVWKLRRVLSGLASEGNPAPGLELLIDRLKQFKNNDEFLAEIGKTPSM